MIKLCAFKDAQASSIWKPQSCLRKALPYFTREVATRNHFFSLINTHFLSYFYIHLEVYEVEKKKYRNIMYQRLCYKKILRIVSKHFQMTFFYR